MSFDKLSYSFTDLFTTSYAEGKSGLYKELVKFLDKKLTTLTDTYERANESIEKVDLNFQQGPNSAEGLIMSTLMEKEGTWKAEMKSILTSMQFAIADLRLKKQEAETQASYWAAQATLEDQLGKVYVPK